MIFLVASLLAILAFGITSRSSRFHRPANLALTALAYLLPALFLASALGWAAFKETGFLRFALLGFAFPAEGEARTVAIGGARADHEVWISALDDNAAEMVKTPAQIEERQARLKVGELRFVPAGPAGKEALVLAATESARGSGFLARRRGGELEPWPALALETGDEIHLGETVWTLRSGDFFGPIARFENQSGLAVDLPRRQGELPILGIDLPLLRAAGPFQATYPLAWLDRASTGTFAEPRPPGLLFFAPSLLGGRLFLTGTDASVTVKRIGLPLPFEREDGLAPGERLHVLSPPRWDEAEFAAEGLRDRRSFRVETSATGLAISYDTPEIYVMRWRDLAELDLQKAEERDKNGFVRIPLALGGWQLADRSLYFEHASTKVALEALTVLELPIKPPVLADLTALEYRATTPGGEREARAGEILWLGARHQAAIQLDYVQPPWLLGVLALLLALLKARVARLAELSTALALAAGVVETLLALRLLLGWQTWALPPFREETFRLALSAWIVLPILILILSQRPGDLRDRRELAQRLPLIAGSLLALALPMALSGFSLQAFVWNAMVLLAWALVWLRAEGHDENLAARLDRIFDRLFPAARELWIWAGLAFLPGILRVALLFAGFRESLRIGERFALTLVHVPLALGIEALFLVWLWRRAETGGLRARLLAPAAFILAGTWALPAFVVSDLGLALLNAPVFLLALGLTCTALARELEPAPNAWVGRIPWLALGLAVLVLMLPAGARTVLKVSDWILPEALSERLLSERNFLRLLDFAAPSELEQVARRSSEELVVMSELLRAYTTHGLLGRGYLATEISPHIQSTALREHVPAIFVAAQWGLLGGAGLALLFVLIGSAAAMLTPGTGARAPGGPLRAPTLLMPLGLLAGLTLALPSLHMVLANYRLALFTGKNAYFLGLDSTADVLEAAILVLLLTLGAAAARDDE